MTTRRQSSTRTKADPGTNGDAPGEFDVMLDDLLDQVKGVGVTPEALMAALSLRISGEDDWPEPRPLPGSTLLPPWPGGLGDEVDAFVNAVAANTATPPAIAAACVLGVASAAITGAVRIHGGAGWYQPANLYLHCLAASGEGRTPVLTWCREPLDAIERERRAAAGLTITQAETRKRMAEAKLASLEKQVGKGGRPPQSDKAEVGDDGLPVEPPKSLEEAIMEVAQEVAAIEIPPMPRLSTREATPMALVQLLGRTNGRLAVMTDEGINFFENASRYDAKGRADWDLYLAGYDGVGYTSDRVGRGETFIPRVTLVVVLLSQPVVLEQLGKDHLAAGRGVYARFLSDMPTSEVGGRPIDREPVPDDLVAFWDKRIRSLADQALAVNDVPHILELDQGARKLLRDFRGDHEPRLRPEVGDLAPIVEWGNKLPGNVLRLALGRHALHTGSISNGFAATDTMDVATTLGHYYTDHALKVFGQMGTDPAVRDAVAVSDWLRRHNWPSVVTTRQIYTSKDWKAERAKTALGVLESYDHVRQLPVVQSKSGGRPPSEPWEINPAHHRRSR